MSSVQYRSKTHAYDLDSDANHFGPIANTIITTLSQDNLYWICMALVELLGLALIIICICWMLQIGGFGFDSRIFNFHPVCMILGMIVANANGILTYRSTKNWSYKKQKTLHLSLQTFAIVVSWIGVLCAFLFHKRENIPHFYSLHSWLGLTALSGVTISLISSFLTFYYPRAGAVYCKLALPFHIFGGICNIALSAGICAIGITEKAIFSLNSNENPNKRYPALPPVAILLNIFGLILVTFTILVVWLVTKPEFKNKYKTSLDQSHHYALRRQTTLED